MSTLVSKLAWKIRCMNLLRRTTRPVSTHPGPILTKHEISIMDSAWEAGWEPKEFVRLLVKRDRVRQSADIPIEVTLK